MTEQRTITINDLVFVDFFHSGAVGNATVVGVNSNEAGMESYDLEVAIIPRSDTDSPEYLKDMGFKTILYNVDGRLVRKIEYEHANKDLGVVDDGSIQDAEVVGDEPQAE